MTLALAASLVLGVGQGPFLEDLQSQYAPLAGERVTVWHVPEDSIKASRVLGVIGGFVPLPGLPAGIPYGVSLYLAPDEGAFARLTGGGVPEWGAGVALPFDTAIVIPAYSSSRGRGWSDPRLLRHEWAHVGLHQYLGGLRAPRWFSEGYAEWASGGWNANEGWRLRVALVSGSPALDSLKLSWPRSRTGSEIAYLLSATTLEYLVRSSGERGLEVFLERWKETESFERAFRATFGFTTAQFETNWRRYVKDRYGWLFVLSHSAIFWLVLTLMMLGMVRLRRGRDREAMARLRATELPEDPAYWMPESAGGGPEDPEDRVGGM